MSDELKQRKIAFLATDGFEQSELEEPLKAIRDAGAECDVIAPKSGEIQGMKHHDKGDKVKVDKTLDEVSADDYDGLVLPGGVANPDALRMSQKAVDFAKEFFRQRKPVAAICHGPWLLVEADVVKGRQVTSWPSLQTDLRNAGAQWVDEECVVDNGLVTSRKPDDLPAFTEKAIKAFAQQRSAAA
ncbi:type 1 glutamine amidotransferase [Proteobacteria bacterium 005FR1]|nr:type 1 glutamine amidotransferase [Proteobacteria bacterium 005FR1]